MHLRGCKISKFFYYPSNHLFLYFHALKSTGLRYPYMSLRELLKMIIVRLELPLTRNLKYDIYTKKIMRRILGKSSNCIDIGCHKGEILDEILQYAPAGKHFAFEPLPHLYKLLQDKYAGRDITLYPIALFDSKGVTSFKYVVNAPAYSGIKEREYDFPDPDISDLTVPTDLLDNLVPENVQIDFIKIDVEGAEFPVLKGGVKTISRCKPVVIFEFGIGAADHYGVKPETVYDFIITDCGLSVSTLKGFLKKNEKLSREKFCSLYLDRLEYYFIAHR
jgi:FkbM family methyltransferase